ncbi:hypothetical protein DWF04_020350 [Cereibacter sphaeroides f. sp. denitrificans]
MDAIGGRVGLDRVQRRSEIPELGPFGHEEGSRVAVEGRDGGEVARGEIRLPRHLVARIGEQQTRGQTVGLGVLQRREAHDAPALTLIDDGDGLAQPLFQFAREQACRRVATAAGAGRHDDGQRAVEDRLRSRRTDRKRK